MTDQEINIAIAEVLGKTRIAIKPVKYNGFKTSRKARLNQIPDYCHDLNAMHEAEGTLPLEKIGQYESNLFEVAHRAVIDNLNVAIWRSQHSLYVALHATARQRGEAFLRTIGKWRDQ